MKRLRRPVGGHEIDHDQDEGSGDMPAGTARHVRWISYAACVWAVAFAAPHIWWALGIPAGFPGGEASYRFFMSSTWRVIYDVVVILLSVLAFVIALTLLKPPSQIVRRWIPHTAAWIACGMLSLRGVAGMIVDGTSDPVWWPTFLLGGILFGLVAWFARRPARSLQRP
jgi:hypothetical protein